MKRNSLLKDIIEVVIAVAIMSFVLLNFVLKPCQVQGTSMVNTLQDKDFGYSFIITKLIKTNRFDICVIKPKKSDEKLLVKRIIGMPNETVEYIDNKLYINGEYFEEPFLDETYTNDFKVTLGEDEYYCLGDNRIVSKDSRYYGAFSNDEILSTHMFVIYPFKNFGVKK